MRRSARIGALCLAAGLLSGCALTDIFAGSIGANTALRELEQRLEAAPSVLDASYDASTLDGLPHATVSVLLADDASAADWAGAAALISEAAAGDALAKLPIEVSLADDSDFSVAFRTSVIDQQSLIDETRDGRALQQKLAVTLTLTLEGSGAGFSREFRGDDDQPDAARQVLGQSSRPEFENPPSSADRTTWQLPGLEVDGELPTRDTADYLLELVGALPLLPLDPAPDVAPTGVWVWWSAESGALQFLGPDESLVDAELWPEVVATSRTVLADPGHRIRFFSYFRPTADGASTIGEFQLVDCPTSRTPTEGDLELAASLAASGVIVPEASLGLCAVS